MSMRLQTVDDASTLTEDQYIDSETLAAVISACFKMARDNRLPLPEQGQLYSMGVVLRDRFKVLVSEIFNAGTQELIEANTNMRSANKELKLALAQINGVAAAIEKLGALVAQLTELVKISGLALA